MNPYEELADAMLRTLDSHRHIPPEPVSGTVRGEMAVLRRLGQCGEGMNAGALAHDLHMTTSRIAAVLNSLEKKAYIVRTSDPGDKRRVMVCLTPTGVAYHQQRREEALRHMAMLLSNLEIQDAETFVRLCGQILEKAPPCAAHSTSHKEV